MLRRGPSEETFAARAKLGLAWIHTMRTLLSFAATARFATISSDHRSEWAESVNSLHEQATQAACEGADIQSAFKASISLRRRKAAVSP